jgi:hypothetical protein
MYAVQQIYALRYHRFEVNLYLASDAERPVRRSPGGGLGVNFYITNVMGVGVNGNVYGNARLELQLPDEPRGPRRPADHRVPVERERELLVRPGVRQVRRLQRLHLPLRLLRVGGVGAISTRPIAVVDPDNRTFEFEAQSRFNVSAVASGSSSTGGSPPTLEVSDYIFFDELENQRSCPASTGAAEQGYLARRRDKLDQQRAGTGSACRSSSHRPGSTGCPSEDTEDGERSSLEDDRLSGSGLWSLRAAGTAQRSSARATSAALRRSS